MFCAQSTGTVISGRSLFCSFLPLGCEKKDEEEINESKKGELRIRKEKTKQQQIKLVEREAVWHLKLTVVRSFN